MSTPVSLTLFCLPYSGASAMFYSPWRRKLPEWLNVRPLELPGRGMRMDSRHPGQGIGLAVVQDILEGYRSSLTIDESSLGGARIRFRLPAAISPERPSLVHNGAKT